MMTTAPQDTVTVEQVLALVDELANISTPTPASRIVRLGLVTELRNELRSSIGGNNRGASTPGRLLIDATSLALWEDITGRIQALPIDLGDEPATKGSLEQILNRWARDLAVADSETRAVQAQFVADPAGLNQDTLRTIHHRLERIRDLIDDHFNPPLRTYPEQCPRCRNTHVTLEQDGHDIQAPAMLLTRWPHNPDRPTNATCRACGATWWGAHAIKNLNDDLEALAEAEGAS